VFQYGISSITKGSAGSMRGRSCPGQLYGSIPCDVGHHIETHSIGDVETSKEKDFASVFLYK